MVKKKGVIFRWTTLICAVYLTISLIVNPETCMDAGRRAFGVCFDVIIPSLFPFFICSGLFSGLGFAKGCSKNLSPLMRPLFGIPGSGAIALVLGVVSGYPMGAVCAADLYRTGECTKTEAERMLAFCNNAGPLFVIGVVGCGFFKSKEIGYYLYVSHIASAILTGMIFRFYQGKREKCIPMLTEGTDIKNKNIAMVIGNVFDNSISSILKVCAFVVIFSIFAKTLPDGKFKPIIHSLFEITGGIESLAGMKTELVFKLVITSFVLALSGVSIVLQVSSVIQPHGISIMPYVKGKITQGSISAVFTYLMVSRLPISRNVFAWNNHLSTLNFSPMAIFASSLCCCLIGIILIMGISFAFGRFRKCCR